MIKSIKRAYNLIRSATRDVSIKRKRSSQWDDVQKEFLSKNPKCEVCGSDKKLNVHHKKPFHLYPELELDESNLITLCMDTKECHLLIGHGNFFKAYNPNVESDAEELANDINKFAEIAAKAKKNRLEE